MEKIAWVVLGVTALVAGIRAQRDDRWRRIGLIALGLLYVVFGALVNLAYLITDTSFADFADGSWIPFVRDTWRDVVAPDQWFWIGLLIVFEAVVGVLVLLRGRWVTTGLIGMIGFHVALLLLSWWLWLWCVPMLIALILLLRAHVRHEANGSAAAAVA